LMITTPAALDLARRRWIDPGGDADAFDTVIIALDAATCHADVRILLTNPPYTVVNSGFTNPNRRDVFTIRVSGQFMLEYTLKEVPPDADVAIVV
jgi:hypothetical protein